MKKLVIHAGLHKTGTSAIQRFLSAHRDELGNVGFFYPPTEPFDAHHRFASRLNITKTNLPEAIKDVNRTLTALRDMSEHNTLLISSEMFCESVDPRSFKYIDNIFEEIEFIFYVRRQDELIESAYNQQVKQNGESRLITEYTPYFQDIYSHLKWFESNIPRCKVRTFIYDKSQLVNQNVVDDFLVNALHIKNFEKQTSNNKEVVNKSLSSVACLLMTRVNKLELDNDTRKNVMNFLMDKLPLREYSEFKLLSDSYENQLFESLLDSNIKLDDEFLNLRYMSELSARPKKYISLTDAINIAEDKGIIKQLSNEFSLDGIEDEIRNRNSI